MSSLSSQVMVELFESLIGVKYSAPPFAMWNKNNIYL